MTRPRAGAAVSLVAALAVACGPSPSPSATGGGMVDATGSWVLTVAAIDERPLPIVEGSAPTMTIDGTLVQGQAPCNFYGTRIVVVDGEVRFGEWESTAMACEELLMASETAFNAAMGRVRSASRDGDALVLTGDGVELRFAPIAELPTDEIVGRPWRLVALVEDGVEHAPGGDVATVIYRRDGSLEGSTGCRTFTGRWTESQERLTATEMAMDQLECPAALLAQDGHVTEVVGNNAASIDGGRLRLQGRFGLGLVYEPAPEG